MAKQTINTIRNWFRTELKPTQAQFWDVFDSFFHKDDKIPLTSLDGLQVELDKKANIGSIQNGNDGYTPYIGYNNNWFINGVDSGEKAVGTDGTPGTSVPVNLALFRVNSGVVPMVDFGWISNLVVSAVVLGATASDISATIAGTVYNKTTIIGVALPAGAKMTNLDVILLAGETDANALIIF